MKSGETLVSAPTQAKGDPETQFSDAEIVTKFYKLAGDIGSNKTLSAIEGAVFDLDAGNASLVRLQDVIYRAPN